MGNKSPNRIDLSISAFDSIANLSSGKAKVLIEVVK
jgi:rare lipoprotein A (peptidoglycan hydrolase)